MSKMSNLIEFLLKYTRYKKQNSNKNAALEYLEKRSHEKEKTYKLPKIIYRTKVKSKEMFGCQILTFNESTTTENIILYLHGGAYVNEIDNFHVIFCDKLAKKANVTVFVPLYPLAPNHTYEEIYEIVEKIYDMLLKIYKPITIMGDSAGGGLSASFCEYLSTQEIKQPEHLILISPWVDISMSGDYEKYVDVDPMLGVEGGIELGKAWAGDLDTKDYRVSPFYGNVDKLPQTTIFVGTHEILYPDIINFYNKLKDNSIDVELNVAENLAHVYPIYPVINESKEAFNHIVEIILSK